MSLLWKRLRILPSAALALHKFVENPVSLLLAGLRPAEVGVLTVRFKRGFSLELDKRHARELIFILYSLMKGKAFIKEVSDEGFIVDWQGYELIAEDLRQLYSLAATLNVGFRIYSKALEIIDEGIRGGTVVDVGAYLGETAVFYASRGAKTVVALEPEPAYFSVLTKVISRNKLENTVIPINAAVSSAGSAPHTNLHAPWWGSSRFESKGSQKQNDITSKNVDEIILNYTPRLIKMNCEGCEIFVLDVGASLLKAVPYWVVQAHGRELGNMICTKFRSVGFDAKLLATVRSSRGIRPTYLFRALER